jgi:5-methylcytosine-specific restriction endonuclease McrA
MGKFSDSAKSKGTSAYLELLKKPEWRKRRAQILLRDNNQCQCCHNDKYFGSLKRGVLGFHPLQSNGNHVMVDIYEDKMLSPCFINFDYDQFEMYLVRVDFGKNYQSIMTIQNFPKNLFTNYELTVRSPSFYDISKKYGIDPPKHGVCNQTNYKEIFAEFHRAMDSYSEIVRKEEQLITDRIDKAYCDLPFQGIFGLHIHHRYYVAGKMPWEYPDEALVTLCWLCHEEIHQHRVTPVLSEFGIPLGELHNCHRCHGAGWFPQFDHVQEGICFRCRGAKYEELIIPIGS